MRQQLAFVFSAPRRRPVKRREGRTRRCAMCRRLQDLDTGFQPDPVSLSGRSMICKRCDEDDDRTAERRTYGANCKRCFGMRWRRPLSGCRACGGEHGPEDVTEAWQANRERTASRWVEPPEIEITLNRKERRSASIRNSVGK